MTLKSTWKIAFGIRRPPVGAERQHRPAFAKHDRWAHVMKRPLAGSDGVRPAGHRIESRHSVTEDQAKPVDGDLGAEGIAMRQRQGNHHAVGIHGRNVQGAVGGPAVGGDRYGSLFSDGAFDFVGRLLRVLLTQQTLDRHINVQWIAQQFEPIAPCDAQRFEPGLRSWRDPSFGKASQSKAFSDAMA